MIFSSTTFLFLFFPLTIIAYYITGNKCRKYKNTILLLASLFFYAWGEPFFVLIMLASIAINYIMVLIMSHSHNKIIHNSIFVSIIIFDLGLLFIYKYLNFILDNISIITHGQTPLTNIALPIGISFFTFQMLSYVFDVHNKNTPPQKNPFYLALYISFFPQLIAGPIVRYTDISTEIDSRKENWQDIANGFARFTFGLGKKVLLANFLSVTSDLIFSIAERSVLSAWLGAICFTLQIYFDFSGYSDMAIGIGQIFGFHFPENFNYPYISCSVTDFWHRWHMTLSYWFRDYVYIPMGGNRVKKPRWLINLFTVWLLTGIWHGANWTFIIWGLLYFVILLFEKSFGYTPKSNHTIFSHVYTMFIVTLGWVIFKANNLHIALGYISNLFGIGAKCFSDQLFTELLKKNATLLVIGILLSTPIAKIVYNKLNPSFRSIFKYLTSIVILYLSILACIEATYQPFLYFNF